jgi:branched-chain amino acid transport system permease protein
MQQYLAEHPSFNLMIMGGVAIAVILVAPRGIVGTLKQWLGFELLPVRRR